MSSSSSIDAESEQYFYGGFNNGTTPWSMHPFIYYTQIPNRHQRSGDTRKRNPNCFVKAFRWYTQERYPCQKTNSNTTNTPDINGFALWLDEKYTEYLEDSRTVRTGYTGAMKQTYTLEADKLSANINVCGSCAAKKKMKILKSPRKRSRKLTNNKNKGDILVRSNKSFQFILRPKNISRANSECLPRQGSCCSNSTATFVNVKSQSLTSVLVEKEVYSIPYDTMRTDDVHKHVQGKGTPGDKYKENTTAIGCTNEKCSDTLSRKRKKSVSCQCSRFIEKIDTHEQYPSYTATKIKKVSKVSCACDPILPSMEQIQLIKNEPTLKACNCLELPKKRPSTCLQNENVIRRNTSVECKNNGTQTSNYAINLTSVHQTPVLMRIVCTDKVKGN